MDKFAQLPWQGPLHLLFGRVRRRCTRHGYRSTDLDKWVGWDEADKHNANTKRGLPPAQTVPAQTVLSLPLRPPDLIIQDELHLISGPLGSMAGLYETAIDSLCSWQLDGAEVRPKLIASTATIRQAQDQVWQVFWRNLAVFPPQVLDAGNSFFALQRPLSDEKPGRRYIGICAPGTRLKGIEVRVYVATLAAAATLAQRHGQLADPWMTLVGYFNALRELGGMRRLVDDDVTNRLQRIEPRGLAKRPRPDVEELTSRVSSSGIPRILDRLGTRYDPNAPPGAPRPIDILLATNMVSVGVDVPRLGLMVAVGQPKATAEYIQATSRVGRSDPGPGLVITIYNWARPRDLSHYETFEHYHDNFYRHVEALSVTPFSLGAVYRGLSAVVAAMARQGDEAWNPNASAQTVAPIGDPYLDAIATEVADRASDAGGDSAIAADILSRVTMRRENWEERQKAEGVALVYKSTRGGTLPLLQEPIPGGWELWTCPTSLREVEAEVNLILDDGDSSIGGAPPFRRPESRGEVLPETDEDSVSDATLTAIADEVAR
ncbi:MAG: helicase-related protein [Dehalococcoidia bacterium]